MPYKPDEHRRRSIRLCGHDYRDGGAYFVTICTWRRECVLGEIRNDVLCPTQRGLIVGQCWEAIPQHRPYVELDAFVLMPNHIHGIIWLAVGAEDIVRPSAPLVSASSPKPKGPDARSLGAVVGAFKAAVTREINKRRTGAERNFWQANYYEHIIRDQRGLEAIRKYVTMNPQRWCDDRENPTGSGRDDYEKFVQSLYVEDQGDTSVAPTTTIRRGDGR